MMGGRLLKQKDSGFTVFTGRPLFNSGFQQEWNRCYINLEMSFYNPRCFAWHIDYLYALVNTPSDLAIQK